MEGASLAFTEKLFSSIFKSSSPSPSGCCKEVSLTAWREEYLKKECTDTHKKDTDVQIKTAKPEQTL